MRKNSFIKKNGGFSYIEALIGVFVCSILLRVLLPSVTHFFKFYKTMKHNEQNSLIQRVTTDITTLIGSTSIETDSLTLTESKNSGFKILNTKGLYLNNITGKSITRYILPFNTVGDTLYIEIPYIKSNNPLNFSNNFHLYRFTVINNITKELSLNYIPGLNEGSRNKPLNFGKEEKILTDIYDGYFLEERGGVVMCFKLKNGKSFSLFFQRVGEL